jgi:hypothetical protein
MADLGSYRALLAKLFPKDTTGLAVRTFAELADAIGAQGLAYNPASTYSIGDMVSSGGQLFISAINNNIGNTPTSNTGDANWTIVAGGLPAVVTLKNPAFLIADPVGTINASDSATVPSSALPAGKTKVRCRWTIGGFDATVVGGAANLGNIIFFSASIQNGNSTVTLTPDANGFHTVPVGGATDGYVLRSLWEVINGALGAAQPAGAYLIHGVIEYA